MSHNWEKFIILPIEYKTKEALIGINIKMGSVISKHQLGKWVQYSTVCSAFAQTNSFAEEIHLTIDMITDATDEISARMTNIVTPHKVYGCL